MVLLALLSVLFLRFAKQMAALTQVRCMHSECAVALHDGSPFLSLVLPVPGPLPMLFPVPTVPSLAYSVTIQPTLKGPATPSIKPSET